MSPRLRSLFLNGHLALILFATAPAVFAQAELLPKLTKDPAPAAAPATPENPADKLRKLLADTRAALDKLNGADASAPEGVTEAALADRRQDLDQLVRTLSRHLAVLPTQNEADKDLIAAKESAQAELPQKPPYSVLLVDDLANQLDLLKEKQASYQSSISLFQRTLDGMEKERATVEAARANAADQLAAAVDSPSALLRWQVDATATKYQLLVSRAESLRASLQLTQTLAAINTIQQKTTERQLATARRSAVFSDEDLEKLQKIAVDRKAALRKEAATLNKKQADAQTARTRAKDALDRLSTAAPDSPETELAKLRLSTADVRADVIQFISENLSWLEDIENYPAMAYKNRRILSEKSSRTDRETALQALTTLQNRLNAWKTVAENELSTVNADLSQQSNTVAAIPADDPRAAVLAEQRAALWEKQNFLQRVSQATGSLRKSFDRWVKEYTVGQQKSLAAHFTDTFEDGWGKIRSIWETPLNTYTVDSLSGPITKSVLLGTVIKALLFFGLSYFIASLFSRKLQSLVARRIHIGEAQASTLRNWLMILVGIGLAIATLNYLEIPLTLFAFFGGALAIGLGFGTQTLIKNFISGIIVLFERKIRVGDIVDIGGLSGSITEINTRSSVLKGADGRETLVPNSLFLENRVTNLTLSNRSVRKLLLIKVAYGSSPQQVIPILIDCVERHGLILKAPEPIVTLEDFGDSALIFGIYYWTEFNAKTNGDIVASDIRLMIEKRFSEAGIQLPQPTHEFPLRTESPLLIELSRKRENTEPLPAKPVRELP